MRDHPRQVARVAVGKLVAHPLLTAGVLALAAALGTPLADPALRTGVILTTACPMFSFYPLRAGRHGEEGLAAAALLGTTMASFFSISVLCGCSRNCRAEPGAAPGVAPGSIYCIGIQEMRIC